jgi:predicted nucleic acid-binding protein
MERVRADGSLAQLPKTIVDANIWSRYLRWKQLSEQDQKLVDELMRLIRDERYVLVGAVVQEVLSGISDKAKFDALKECLSPLDDYEVPTEDYILAAEFSNKCRIHGVQGSPTDFLICAVAVRNGWEIFTEDKDFLNYGQHFPLTLHQVAAGPA